MALDGGVDRQARLVEAQARGHVPHRRLRRLEIAAPGRKLIADLVVVDEGQFGQGGLAAQPRIRQERGRADRKDLLVHEILDLAAGMVIGAADRHVERAVIEVALGDDGRDADVDLGGAGEEALQLGHQPKGGDGGGGGHRDLLPPAPAIQGDESGLEFVEPLGEFLQGARRRRREYQLAALALEQGCFKELLEGADLMADGRRRDAEFRRGPREAEVTGGTLERAQCIQGDVGPHTPSSDPRRPSTISRVPSPLKRLHGTGRRTRSKFLQCSAEALGSLRTFVRWAPADRSAMRAAWRPGASARRWRRAA
jgi:hypothetical protein